MYMYSYLLLLSCFQYGALVFSSCDFIKDNMAPTQHLDDLTEKLEDCLCNFQFTQFKVSIDLSHISD